MIRNKIIYLILVISAILFFILYADNLSLLLLILSAVFPVFMGIVTIAARLCIKADITSAPAAVKDTETQYKITVRNKSVFPYPNSIITVEYKNIFGDNVQEFKVSVPIPSRNTQCITFGLSSNFCGRLSVKIKNIRIYDYIKLFSAKVRCRCQCSTAILPQTFPVKGTANNTAIMSNEGDVFSKYHSGDDPSEIFDLKNYVPGDKINRIHWNLTMKQDELITKHYSQPVESSILIAVDMPEVSGKNILRHIDAAAETAASLSNFFIENEALHKLCCLDKKSGEIILCSITDISDITAYIVKLLSGECGNNIISALSDSIGKYSKFYYIAPSVSDSDIKKLSEYADTEKTIASADIPESAADSENLKFIKIEPERLETCLSQIII